MSRAIDADRDFLDALSFKEQRDEPLVIVWPTAGNLASFLSFATLGEWREFLVGLGVDPLIPLVVKLKFQRAQKVHYCGWIDPDLIKAGELVALTALELALVDRYGKKSLAQLLAH